MQWHTDMERSSPLNQIESKVTDICMSTPTTQWLVVLWSNAMPSETLHPQPSKEINMRKGYCTNWDLIFPTLTATFPTMNLITQDHQDSKNRLVLYLIFDSHCPPMYVRLHLLEHTIQLRACLYVSPILGQIPTEVMAIPKFSHSCLQSPDRTQDHYGSSLHLNNQISILTDI